MTGFEIACAKAIPEDGLLKTTTSPPGIRVSSGISFVPFGDILPSYTRKNFYE